MDALNQAIAQISDVLWNSVLLFLLVGTGVYFSVRTRFVQVRKFKTAWNRVFGGFSLKGKKAGKDGMTSFQALATAIAAQVGTGNIAGCATALVSGGPGAIFWMWLAAFFGMATIYGEAYLAQISKRRDENGEVIGGPVYYITHAFKGTFGKALAGFFAVAVILALGFMGNMVQSNSISDAFYTAFSVPKWVMGVIVAVLAAFIFIGGISRIASFTEKVVPVMAALYLVGALVVILINIQHVPSAIASIFICAFRPDAVFGAAAGITVRKAMRYGVARGVFSNEAGMGSAAITAAAATTDDPVRQGYINMTGTFWDTIVVCTITGLCIASSGVLGMTDTTIKGTYDVESNNIAVVAHDNDKKDANVNYAYELKNSNLILKYVDDNNKENTIELTYSEKDKQPSVIDGTWNDAAGNEYIFEGGKYEYKEVVKGAALTIAAFSSVLGKLGGYLVTIGIVLFAFSTILGWEYHGEKAFEYIFNTHKFNMVYRIVFSLVVFVGATTALDVVWNFSDIANALMAIPNLICLLALSGVIAKEVERFQPEVDKAKRKNK